MKPLFKLLISLVVKLGMAALIYAIVMGLTGCRISDKPEVLSFSTANTEETEITTKTTSRVTVTETSEEPSPYIEQAKESVSTDESQIAETTQKKKAEKSTQQTRQTVRSTKPARNEPKKTTKARSKATSAPTKKPETSTKAPTKAPTTAPTKKPTNTPTPKPYTYCTCDAEISCGSTAAGTFHKFTLKGLTAHKLKSGLWEITEASDDKVRAYLKENYPGYGRYGVGKLKNKRDYRYKP